MNERFINLFRSTKLENKKLMKTKINSILAIIVLVFIALACNASFTTANISSFNFGKNDKAEPATTSFNEGEKVFAVATLSGVMGKYKVRFKVENTSGGQPLTKDVEMPGDGTAYLEITNVAGGEYKAEAALLDESGKEVDKKSGTFSVKGDRKPTTTTTETKKDSDSVTDSEEKSNDN